MVPPRHTPPVVAVLLCVCMLAGCQVASSHPLDASLLDVTERYGFSAMAWEAEHILGIRAPHANGAAHTGAVSDEQVSVVEEYARLTQELNALSARMRILAGDGDGESLITLRAEWAALTARQESLAGPAARILGAQIRRVAADLGIRTPADRFVALPLTFPPVWFAIGDTPHVLVVSPRDRIESIREVLLVQEMDVATMEAIEAQIDALGYSSLVTRVGGFGGLYPALVANSASVSWLVETAAEEWLHQYLAFTPLGFRYVLDLLQIAPDYDVATLNETLAGLVSEEIARQVLLTYYPEYAPPPEDAPDEEPPEEEGFSFNRAMRETRQRVDALLAEGRVAEAERYMEERRQLFVENGYALRKLNQAYFAFHGAYADQPTSVDPLGEQLRTLRARSASLADFLGRAVVLRGREDLAAALERGP